MSTVQQSLPSNPAPTHNMTHPVRRENASISSTHSRGSERSSRSQPHPAVESAVTRLLVAIKQLLEALALWSNLKMSETQVSDVYVRLGNDFNAAVAAFGQFNIDMSELLSVPDDLRGILEQCLSEDATPSNLEIYLPTVRRIITNLLQGLRNKQSIYRRIVSDRRHRSGDSQGHERERTSRPESKTARSENGSAGPSRSSRGIPEGESGLTRTPTLEGQSRRKGPTSTRRKESSSQASVSSRAPSDGDYFAGGFVQPRSAPADEEQIIRSQSDPRQSTPRAPDGSPTPQPLQEIEETPSPSTPPVPPEKDDPNDTTVTSRPLSHPPVPANVTRYSLKDEPVIVLPSVTIDEPSPTLPNEAIAGLSNGHSGYGSSTPPLETPPIDAMQTPAMASHLAALKKSDALERRASKRFSTYNISKMTGSGGGGGGGGRERNGTGRTAKRMSMLADSSVPTPGELDVLTEVDEPAPGSRDDSRSKSRERSPSKRARLPSPFEEDPPPIPPLPASVSHTPEPAHPSDAQDTSPEADASGERPLSPAHSNRPISEPSSLGSGVVTLFLQVGRVVKKVTIEPGLSLSSLRVLFVDRFSYNPGQDNFPAIYIRDPSSGVMYELEDISEVKDKCLLSLNIEPLDQIKQHIDSQMSTLAQELKELRTAVSSSRRISHTPAIIGQSFTDISPVDRPSDRRFQTVARNISRLVTHDNVPPQLSLAPQMTGQTLQSQMTGGSMLSEASGRIVTDLKNQFDEVQNLRRDLGVMRQLYTDFMGQTKDSLSTLRTQTQSVRQLANAKVGGARAYIESGKTKLDARSQKALTRVEDLQDTVENLKEDVLKRYISPKSHVLKTVNGEISEVAAELDGLKEYINTVKPMWKKTWAEELQNIVEEQQFLKHQEEFLDDLLEDHKALSEVYGHVQKVISIRGTGSGKTRGQFRPPPPEEGHNGLSTVMMEIRGAAIDPDRRMKAIAANQKNREKELATRSDEFEAELKGFVGGKKLKMTGGADEIERVRQRKNDLTLKAMFNNSAGTSTPGSVADTGSLADSNTDSNLSDL